MTLTLATKPLTLASIKDDAIIKTARHILYGPPKIGKTTFCSSAHKPIFIFTERGRGVLSMPRFVFEPEIGREVANSSKEVFEALALLAKENHDYKTLVIDSVTSLEQLIWKDLCKEHNEQAITQNSKGSAFSFGRGYDLAMTVWLQLLKALDYLSELKGMQIILIAHSQIVTFKNPQGDDYDKFQIDLHKAPAAHLKHWVDCILFANYKILTKEVDQGFGKSKAKVLDNQGQRVIFTEERPAFWAGNRYNLPFEIPFTLRAGVGWHEIETALSLNLNKNKKEEQSNVGKK